jgi:DNA primase
VAAIGDSTIADYYRRDFDQRVFDAFKRRAPSAGRPQRANERGRFEKRGYVVPRPGTYGGGETVSAAVKASILARSGRNGALRLKEFEIAALLFDEPGLAERHGELLAELPITDASLDRLRQQLLNLAASGSRLEKQGLENHLGRLGMAELVARLNARAVGGSDQADAADADAGDVDARFLQAASDLREMAEREPERARAMERFKNEGTEESWLDAQKLLGIPPGD